jgi:hypothetical protein
MELQSIVIFALIGALTMAIVAGGVTSMLDEDATTTTLGSGAALGGLLGAAAGYFQSGAGGMDDLVPDTIKHVMSGGGSGGLPNMKVGLPAF